MKVLAGVLSRRHLWAVMRWNEKFGDACRENGPDSAPVAERTEIGHSGANMTKASTNPLVGCWKAKGSLPTTSKPRLCQSFTARSFVLTTKLNCMARKPDCLACSLECKHIVLAMPRPVA